MWKGSSTIMSGVKFIVFSALFALNTVFASDKVFMCYYGTWATYRNGLGKFDVANIDTSLCTHLIYTFVGIDEQGTVISLDPWLDLPDDGGRDNFGHFNALKQINPNLKTILAVGGWNEGSEKYSNMAADPALRKNFIDSALAMVLRHGFDGFDLDWEYPNQRDSVHGEADIDNFSTLCKEMKEAFTPHGLELSAAVAAVEESASKSYDVVAISTYLDYINIMTYDFYGAWDTETGLNAPLYFSGNYSIDKAVNYWLDKGCPPEKLVLGMPLYGRTFKLVDSTNQALGAPTNGEGIAGPYTATNGYIGYNELCVIMQTETWNSYWEETCKVPYVAKDYNWVSYDNQRSLYIKTKYALEKNLAGAMVWSIETDDFHAQCNDEAFPLLKTIQRTLNGEELVTDAPEPNTDSTSAPDVTTPSSGSTFPTSSAPAPTNHSICSVEGFTPNPSDCNSFYVCMRNADGGFNAVLFKCPSNLHWDQTYKYCNYPEYVPCFVKFMYEYNEYFYV